MKYQRMPEQLEGALDGQRKGNGQRKNRFLSEGGGLQQKLSLHLME
jgi:hypothetical protein